MKSSSTLVAMLALFTMACGGQPNESGTPDTQAPQGQQQASLDAGDPLVASWRNGDWVQTIYADGNGYMSAVSTGYPCWAVGMQSFRNLVATAPRRYVGECGICNGYSVDWVPVSIMVTDDNQWMQESFSNTYSWWYRQ